MSALTLADLFAGGGGFSTGVASACEELQHTTDTVAVNHWEIAARTYKKNHPTARVLCTGLDAVDPAVEVASGRLNLLAASPECTHHSNARGGKPMSDQSRSSPWLILKWLQELYVESVLIENVQEFADWGPLGANQRPLIKMKGLLFEQFLSSLKALGYNVEWRVLCSADYGGATTRERLFIMARRGRNKRVIWPDPTHGPDARPRWDSKRGDYTWGASKQWRSAREIIDWSTPSQSIFSRKKPLAVSTLERIAAGFRKFGGKDAEPFLVVLRQHMDGRSLNDPLPTITAGGSHIGLCEPFILPQFGDATARSVDRPVGAITTTSRGMGLVEPFVLSMEHAKKNPFIVPLNHGTTKGGGHRVYDVDAPMPTITTVDAWGVVEPFLVDYHGNHSGRTDGNGRVVSVDRPLPTQDTSNRFGVVEPFIINAGGPTGQGRNARSVDEPMSTVLTDDHHAIVQSFIISYYGTTNVSSVDAPLPTCTQRDRFGLVQFAPGLFLDIHFRMLQWRELAAAMGFPPEYEFCGTREEKVMQIGNAVEVRTARSLAMSALSA